MLMREGSGVVGGAPFVILSLTTWLFWIAVGEMGSNHTPTKTRLCTTSHTWLMMLTSGLGEHAPCILYLGNSEESHGASLMPPLFSCLCGLII